MKQVMIGFFLLFNYFYSPCLYSQNQELTKKDIVHWNIKSCTTSKCKFVYGQPDKCETQDIDIFDKNGNKIEHTSIINKNRFTKTYLKYDTKENLIEEKYIDGKDTSIIKYEYDSQNKKIKKSIFKNSQLKSSISTEYNSIGKICKVKNYESGILISNSEINYDIQGKEISKKVYTNNKLSSYYNNSYVKDLLTLSIGYNSNNKLIYLYKSKYDDFDNEIENLYYAGYDSILTTATYNKKKKLSKRITIKPDSLYKSITDIYYNKDTIAFQKRVDHDNNVTIRKYQYDDKKRLIQLFTKDSGRYMNTSAECYFYDDKNRLLETDFKSDTSSQDINSIRKYSYDTTGTLTSILYNHNALGKISKSCIYDENGKLIKMVERPYIGNKDSIVHFYTYNPKTGNKIQETIQETKIGYIIKYTYDRNGNVKTEEKHIYSEKLGEMPFEDIEYEYDSKNNLINKISRSHGFDAFKLLPKEEIIDTVQFNSALKYYSNMKYCLTYKYDKNNHLISEYEDKKRFNTNNGSDPKKYFYNEKGQLVEKQDFNHLDTNRISIKRTYEYDVNGNLITETCYNDGKSNIAYLKKFEYNSSNKLTDEFEYAVYGQDNEHKKYYYNSEGEIIKEITYTPQRSIVKYVYEFGN